MKRLRLMALTSVGLVSISLLAPFAAANPSHDDPHRVMPIFLPEYNKAVYDGAVDRLQRADAAMDKLLGLQQRNRIGSASAKMIEQAYVDIEYLRDFGHRLKVAGETAGHDFANRGTKMRNMLDAITTVFQGTPAGAKARQSAALAYEKKLATAYPRELQQMQKLSQEGKHEQAWEQFLETKYKTIVEHYILDAPPESYEDIQRLLPYLRRAAEQVWAEAANAALVKKRAAVMPDLAGLLRSVEGAATAIGSSGKATIGESTFDGPGAVQFFHQRWRNAHVSTIQAAALEYGRISIRANEANQGYQQILKAYEDFSGKMVGGLANLVHADVQRAAAPDCPKLHADYLAALGPLAAEIGQDGSGTPSLIPLFQALEAFKPKSPELAKEITAYEQATRELLRWRQRVAEAKSIRATGRTASLAEQFRQATLIRENQDTPGYLYANQSGPPELISNVPDVMIRASSQLMNQPAVFGSSAKASPSARNLIGRYDARTYAIIGDPASHLAPHVKLLQADLLADEQHPPRTLDAAAALESAQNAMFLKGGGEIIGCHTESVVVRKTTLPEVAHPFVRLGRTPVEPRSSNAPSVQLLMRFDVKPAWVANRYFFADFSGF